MASHSTLSTFPLPGGDLDGDGAPEVVVVKREDGGRGTPGGPRPCRSRSSRGVPAAGSGGLVRCHRWGTTASGYSHVEGIDVRVGKARASRTCWSVHTTRTARVQLAGARLQVPADPPGAALGARWPGRLGYPPGGALGGIWRSHGLRSSSSATLTATAASTSSCGPIATPRPGRPLRTACRLVPRRQDPLGSSDPGPERPRIRSATSTAMAAPRSIVGDRPPEGTRRPSRWPRSMVATVPHAGPGAAGTFVFRPVKDRTALSGRFRRAKAAGKSASTSGKRVVILDAQGHER